MTIHGELTRPLGNETEQLDFSTLRASVPRIEETGRKRFRVPIAGVVAISLLLGVAVGGLVVRQRYKANEVIAAINGQVIKQNVLYHVLERMSGETVMRELVQDELTVQFAAAHNAMPTDADVEKRLAEEESTPDFKRNLDASGQTEDDLRRKLRVQLAQANVIRRGVTVTDEEVHKFYLENIDKKNLRALYYTPESATGEIIVTANEEDGKKAEQALNEGVEFATVAEKFSKDGNKFNGGRLPPIVRGRTSTKQIPGLADVLFNMTVDQRIGPKQIDHYWCILHCIDRRPETLKSFSQVSKQCQDLAILSKGFAVNKDAVNKEFADFRKIAKIQMFWEQFKGVIKQ